MKRSNQVVIKRLRAVADPEIQASEAFEISEYGRKPNAEEIRRLFPFYGTR